MKRVSTIALLLVFVLGAFAELYAEDIDSSEIKANFSAEQLEVWEREELYWEARKANDYDAYMSLWHQDFSGWPFTSATPVTIESISNGAISFMASRPDGALEYKLEPMGVSFANDKATTFYRVSLSYTTYDGALVAVSGRIIHTFVRDYDSGKWLIISGMSAVP